MKVLLIKNNRLYNYILPKEVKDNYWITDIDSFDNARNLINVEAHDGRWVLVSNYDTHIVDASREYNKVVLSEYQFYSIKNENEEKIYYLYAIPNIENTYKAYNVSLNSSITIGTNSENDIVYKSYFVNDYYLRCFFLCQFGIE